MDIKALIESLSLEEKVAQLCGIWITKLIENDHISPEKCKKWIPHGIGHVCQFASTTTYLPEKLAELVEELQDYVKKETDGKIPVLFHDEAITDVAAKGAAVFPQMINMSCTWDPELVYKNARITGENMKRLGAYYALSPMMDVITDARWGRGEEGFGEDAYLVTNFITAYIKGLQGEGVAATAKHFAGYGVDNQDLEFFRNGDASALEAAVKDAGVKALMPGYHAFHDVPCPASEFLLRKVLREEWGFDGMIVSDYGAIPNVASVFHYASTNQEAAIACIKAGTDVDLPDMESYGELVDAVREGKISEEFIDESLYRVLKLKQELGLFEGKAEKEEGPMDLDRPEYREQALNCARQSIVLLKNDGILPLAVNKQKVALVGPNADSCYSLLGDYTWAGISEFFHGHQLSREEPHLVTLREALEKRLGNTCDITFARGCDWSKSVFEIKANQGGDERALHAKRVPLEPIPETNWEKAMEIASESDLIIAGMGENRYLCGENCDRETVNLPGEQEQFVEQLCSFGKPVILVIFGGRPLAIGNLADKCAAVLYGWYPGEEGGNAVVDILSGEVNPSAKLTVTMPNVTEDVPVHYQTADKKPGKYPFGFGLSYTDYTYEDLKAPTTISMDDDYFDISFTVRNVGDRDGIETAQVYLTSKDTGKKNLIGFSRIHLKKGASEETTIRFYLDTFARYDAEGQLFLNPEKWTIQVGASSEDIRLVGELALEGERTKLEKKEHFVSKKIK